VRRVEAAGRGDHDGVEVEAVERVRIVEGTHAEPRGGLGEVAARCAQRPGTGGVARAAQQVDEPAGRDPGTDHADA
jgi:hypothetical protein